MSNKLKLSSTTVIDNWHLRSLLAHCNHSYRFQNFFFTRGLSRFLAPNPQFNGAFSLYEAVKCSKSSQTLIVLLHGCPYAVDVDVAEREPDGLSTQFGGEKAAPAPAVSSFFDLLRGLLIMHAPRRPVDSTERRWQLTSVHAHHGPACCSYEAAVSPGTNRAVQQCPAAFPFFSLRSPLSQSLSMFVVCAFTCCTLSLTS